MVIWFGFFSVRGCNLHLMGCSRSLVYEGSGSQCVSDSKEISKVIKPGTFFFCEVCWCGVFWKHVLSLKLGFWAVFFSWYNFVRLVGSFHEIEYEMRMTSYVLNMLNLPHIPNIPNMKSISTKIDLRLLPSCKVEGRVNPLKMIWCCCS